MSLPAEAYIYTIKCLITDDAYVGSTAKLAIRWNGHRFDLKHNRHANSHLQSAWNLYGESSFAFITVETLEKPTKAELRKAEANWIELIGTYNIWQARDGVFVPSDALRSTMSVNTANRWIRGDFSLQNGLDKAREVAHANAAARMTERWKDEAYAERERERLKSYLTPEHQKAATDKRWAQDGAHEHQSAKLTEAWKSREKKSGLPRGITFLKNQRYKVSLWINGKTKHIGCYDTVEQAEAAYQAAKDGR